MYLLALYTPSAPEPLVRGQIFFIVSNIILYHSTLSKPYAFIANFSFTWAITFIRSSGLLA
jgi:hypothetical protein